MSLEIDDLRVGRRGTFIAEHECDCEDAPLTAALAFDVEIPQS